MARTHVPTDAIDLALSCSRLGIAMRFERPAIHRPRPVARPAVRLFVFHHAGGSSSEYASWQRFLPRDWELGLVDLPGRGVNARLPLARTRDELVAAAIASLEPFTDVPFACHGHSLGGLVAHAAVRALQATGQVLPFWLGVSAARSPRDAGASGNAAEILSLSDEALLADLRRFGGAPEGLLAQSRALAASFLTLFRADVSALVSPGSVPADEPLPIPITAFAGAADPFAPPSTVASWSSETHAFSLRVLEGDHFFVFSSRTAFLDRLVRDATAALHGDPHGAE